MPIEPQAVLDSACQETRRFYRTKLGALSCLGLLFLNGCQPPDEPTDLVRGLNAFDEQEYLLSRDYLQRHLDLEPNSDTGRLAVAEAWRAGPLQSPSQAAEHLQTYLSRHPDDLEARLNLVGNLRVLHDTGAALTLIDEAPESPRTLRARALIVESANPDQARELLDRWLRLDPEDQIGLALAVRLFRTTEPERALDFARRALRLDPFDRTTTYLAARLYRATGDVEQAKDLMARHQLLSDLEGSGSKSAPSPSEALPLVRELASKTTVASTSVQLRLAELLTLTDRTSEARDQLEAIDRTDLSPEQTLLVGRLASRSALDELAKACFATVLELPVSEHLSAQLRRRRLRQRVREERVSQAMRNLDHDAAYALVQEGLGEFPDGSILLAARAQLELHLGDPEAARSSLQQLLEIAPWRDRDRVRLAELLVANGQIDEVAGLLDAAPRESPLLDQLRRKYQL